MPESPRQFTSLFGNDVLARLERLRINSARRFTNRSRGEHLSGKGGSSTEFADYRDYVEGDDVRFVDWNLFARLNRPYLKLFHHEEELHVLLLVDASASMKFEGKMERARQLAAAFGIMGLLNNERVSCRPINARNSACLPPCTGRSRMAPLVSFLETLEPGGTQPVEATIEEALKQHRGRGVAILISDFLTFGSLERPLNMLFSRGLEIFAIQTLGPSEIEPELTGDARFVDSETGQTLDVTAAGDLIALYDEYRRHFEQELAVQCRRRSGRFLRISTDTPLKTVLFDLLTRKGWIQ